MPTSKCVSQRHQEYDCRIKYSVTKKFTAEQWCEQCRQTFKEYIDDGRFPTTAKKTRRRTNG